MTEIIRVVTGLLAIAGLAYFVNEASNAIAPLLDWTELPGAHVLGGTLILTLLWIAMLEAFWASILRRQSGGTAMPARAAIRWTYAKSYLARYVPGKLWPFVIRGTDLALQGVPWRITLQAILVEQLAIAYGSVIVVLAIFTLLFVLISDSVFWTMTLVVIVWLTGAWTMTRLLASAAVVSWMEGRAARLSVRLSAVSNVPFPLPTRGDWRDMLRRGTLLSIGQGLTATPIVLEMAPQVGMLECLAICLAYPAARWGAQLVGVAPGGLGVREGFFVALVAPVLAPAPALLIAFWLRVIAIGSEALFFGWAAWGQYRGGGPRIA